ncbi:MAG: hypothetical protein U0Q47_00760 [Mycobacterium sp.]
MATLITGASAGLGAGYARQVVGRTLRELPSTKPRITPRRLLIAVTGRLMGGRN